jgi:hypothetical protein
MIHWLSWRHLDADFGDNLLHAPFLLRNTNALVTLTLVSLVGITLAYVNMGPASDWWSISYLALLGVGGGCYVLSRLRPQSMGLSPPHVMLSLGFGGMLIGLFFDFQRTPVAVIASICSSTKNLSLMDSLILHMQLMPYMHIGMLIGGLAAIPSLRLLRPECRKLCSMLAQNVLCSGWMLLGMTLGAVFFVQVIQQSNDGNLNLGAMLAGMFAGMVWGMVLSVFLYRSYFSLRDWQQQNKNRKACQR